MARRLRFIPPGSLVEVTCRTVQGRLLLRPSPLLRDLTLGILARAARLYPVQVHAFAFLSNHYHLLLTVPDAHRLARFMNYLNSNLAREAGRLHRWREKFWGRRYQAILVADEEVTQIARLRYILSQGTKEGLVATPLDWPGAHCARALLKGLPVTGTWYDRTLEYRARRKSLPLDPSELRTREELQLSPLPCWRDLSGPAISERVRELVAGIEAEAASRVGTSGKPALGRDVIFRQNPHLEPNRVQRSPAPLAHAISKEARSQLREAYRRFVDAYRQAAATLRAKAPLVALFPPGSFPPAMPYRLANPSG
jgi:REP element-mobilizing transposase RayT